MDLQYSRYFYDGLIFDKNADYNEFYLFLHYKGLLSAQILISMIIMAQGEARYSLR